MSIRIKIENSMDETFIHMEADGTDSVGDLISSALQYWDKDDFVFVMKRGNRLLPANLSVEELGLKDGDSLVLVPDPQGG